MKACQKISFASHSAPWTIWQLWFMSFFVSGFLDKNAVYSTTQRSVSRIPRSSLFRVVLSKCLLVSAVTNGRLQLLFGSFSAKLFTNAFDRTRLLNWKFKEGRFRSGKKRTHHLKMINESKKFLGDKMIHWLHDLCFVESCSFITQFCLY